LGKIILIRGLPGSGKTTAAKEFDCFHLEADMFFVRDNIYSFNKEHIKEAHEFCQKNGGNNNGNRCGFGCV